MQALQIGRTLTVDDMVIVARPIGMTERKLLGLRCRLIRFTQPHGFAVIRDERGIDYAVHPEGLCRDTEE